VLVVGTGQSGCQIAEELYQAGRTVYLSTSRAGRAPRRFRGRDVFVWLREAGILARPVAKLEDPAERFSPNPHVSGKGGGHDLNLHQFARDGVRLLGRLAGAEAGRVQFLPNLHANLAQADQFEAELAKGLNNLIAQAGLEAPPDDRPQLRDGYAVDAPTDLDLRAEGITSVIWAAGFTWDFSLVQAPVFDTFGYPVQTDGATRVPGLFFLGLPWLRRQSSGLLWGVGEDAGVVADRLGSERRLDAD
jgi:putative flavoprotein involved in K+ transport